jgi:amino acid transporter
MGVGLACTNAASRVMYAMGRAGTLSASFGYIHPIHRTPTFAIAFVQLSGIAAILLVGFLLQPDTIFGFLETIATLAVIILYVMANLPNMGYGNTYGNAGKPEAANLACFVGAGNVQRPTSPHLVWSYVWQLSKARRGSNPALSMRQDEFT